MPRPRDHHRKKELQAAIAHLFAQKGYHATSMRDIGRQLGMNQASLYHYFQNKEDILFGLMNDAMDEALKTLERICESDLSPEDKLNRILRFYTRYYAGDQHLLILLVAEMDSLGMDCRRILIQFFSRKSQRRQAQ